MKNQSTLDKILRTINESNNGYYLRYDIEDILKENKLDISLVAKNLDYIIMNVIPNKFPRLLNYLSIEATLNDNILKNINAFLKRFKKGDILDKEQEAFFEMILFLPGYKKVLYRYMKNVIESISPGVLFEQAEILKEISPLMSKKIESKINLNIDSICKHILYKCLAKNNNRASITIRDFNDYSLTLQILFREVLKNEGKKFSDVKKLGEGVYSQTFKLGNKIIKVGAPRETYTIPNHRRLLQPLARINLTNMQHKSIGTIEVSDEVDTKKETIEKISQEQLYEIYKELRDDGIVWGDPKKDNLGVLKRKNIPMINGKPFYVDPLSIGFDSDLKSTVPLNKGDIVIVDTDYLYRQEQKNKKGNNNSYVLYFERRYQNEKKQENISLQDKSQTNKLLGKEKENEDEFDY